MLHRALESALRLGFVQRNVTEYVDAPRLMRIQMKTWTPEQARAFLSTAENDRLYSLYMMALSTGMRQGDLLGLRWSDVDLDRASVSINVSLQRSKRGLNLAGRPKTHTSRRRIALTEQAVSALREHRKRQLEERFKLGEFWEDHDLVFANTHGGAHRSSNLVHQSYKPLMRKAGVPEIRFNDLRHTCATVLLLPGVNPKVVSEMLGHASIAITLDLYSHVLPDMQRQADTAMTSALWG